MTDPRDFGAKPKLTWLPVNRLTVDMRYQRTLESLRSQKLIERMVAEFNWQRFGAIWAGPGAVGTYSVIDGQHRVAVLRRLGEPEAPAILLESATLAEQARAFVAANRDRVSVNPFALHHALVQAGDQISVAVDALCQAAGVSIPRYPLQTSNMKPDQTLALGALKKLATFPDSSHAVRALKILRAAFPDEPGALRAHTITGLAQFIVRRADIDDDALAAALASAGLQRLDATVWRTGGGTVARVTVVMEYLAALMPKAQPTPHEPAQRIADPLRAAMERLDREESQRPRVQAKPAPASAPKPQAAGRNITSALMGDPDPNRRRA